MPDLLLNDEARSYVGQTRSVRERMVRDTEIRKYCAGIRDLNPIYLDHDAAVAAGYRGVVCPPLFMAGINRPVPLPHEMLPDGQLDNLALPPLVHLATMAGGVDTEVYKPVVAGDMLREEFRIADLYEREARSGPLAFQIMEVLFSVSGELVQRDRVTLILRKNEMSDQLGDSSAATPLPEPEPGTFFLERSPSPVDMFSYTGAFWTTHRIHYDPDWARSEGFRGAVVVGPMQASYIATLLESGLDAPAELVTINARFRAPLCVGESVRVEAWIRSRDGNFADVEARVVRQDGVTTVLGAGRIRYRA